MRHRCSRCGSPVIKREDYVWSPVKYDNSREKQLKALLREALLNIEHGFVDKADYQLFVWRIDAALAGT